MVNPSESQPFFILGGVKCGTTFLQNSLNQHPKICFSEPKEPKFFMLDVEYEQGVDFYFETYFPHYQDEPVFGDARTNHLSLPWVPGRIHSLFPNAKLVAIVRDPVERAYSDYYHARRHAVEENSFENALMEDLRRIKSGRRLVTGEEKKRFQKLYRESKDRFYKLYLDGGYYAEMISRYLRYYSFSDLRIVQFQDLVENPLSTCNKIFDDLGLDPLNALASAQTNAGTVPKSYWVQSIFQKLGQLTISELVPSSLKRRLMNINLRPKSNVRPMKDLTRHWLAQHYEPHNKYLERFLDGDLEAWTDPRDIQRKDSRS